MLKGIGQCMTAYDRYIKWPESLDVVVLDIWLFRRQLLKKKIMRLLPLETEILMSSYWSLDSQNDFLTLRNFMIFLYFRYLIIQEELLLFMVASVDL